MRMSTRPNSESAFAAIASTSLRLATSAMIGRALTPSAWASRATDWASCSLLRALTTTCAPSPARCSTVARPILRPEPVTSATFPSSLPMTHLHDDHREVEGIGPRWQRQTAPALPRLRRGGLGHMVAADFGAVGCAEAHKAPDRKEREQRDQQKDNAEIAGRHRLRPGDQCQERG